MERTMEITLISAEDLRKVNLLSKMKVYAVAWLSSDPTDRRSTAPDDHNSKNPKWSAGTFVFKIPDVVDLGSLLLNVQLKTLGSLGGDRIVGKVSVSVRELEAGGAARRFVSYRVTCANGKPKGTLHFSCAFKYPLPIEYGYAAPQKHYDRFYSTPPHAFSSGYASVYHVPPPPPPPLQYPPHAPPFVAYGYGYHVDRKYG